MDSKEFTSIRKKLQKTQKETASLLGISLKAVCSYEQGWRSIPSHVERQLYFLFSRKLSRRRKLGNCWEIKNCPPEKKEQCPAWEFDSGEFCWFINGTICDNITHKNWADKFAVCRKCAVVKNIR
ncbi:MAG: helix-turn-helix domain-containing protein [Desulforhopalus sp.]